MTDLVVLLLGVLCAGCGGELFLAGLVRLSRFARISHGIAATTLAAFATSSSELTVAVNSALSGAPEIALGDALGSNVVNCGLILGLVAVIAPIRAGEGTPRRDRLAAALGPLPIAALALDGRLSRGDGLVLLGAFGIWLAATFVEARRQRRAPRPADEESHPWRGAALAAAGVALLIVAGHLVVLGARGIAAVSGMHEFVIGATLVAVGTSVPELAISAVSQLRGRHELGLGTVLGSNVFNGWFIVGVAAVLCPITLRWSELSATLAFGAATVVVVVLGGGNVLGRARGLLLLVLYVLHVLWVTSAPGAS